MFDKAGMMGKRSFATVPFSHNTPHPACMGVWVIDWQSRQGYKVCVVMAPCER